MKPTAHQIATRIAALPSQQRAGLLRRMAEQGIDAAALPIVPYGRNEPLPVSDAQRGLWLTWRIAPHSAAYNMSGTLLLKGALDKAALRRALDDLAQRHEVLRTVFRENDAGEPEQIVLPTLPGYLHDETADAAVHAMSIAEAIGRTQRHLSLPFDLADGPPWRVLLLQLDAQTHRLSIVAHHIVADGWSVGVLLKDLAALYEAHALGRSPTLPPLPIQFADYAVWQSELAASGEMSRQLDYWSAQLGTEHPVLTLPSACSRPAVRSDAGARIEFSLPQPMAAALQRLAEANGCTVFMAMVSLLGLTLSRLSGLDDIRVGTPVADRRRAETHDLAGYLTNMLVLRTRVDARGSFRALLTEVRETVLDAHGHADCPFDRLVTKLAANRVEGIQPLFQVKCAEQRDDDDMPDFGPLVASGCDEGAEVHAHFDLSFDFTVRPHEIACDFVYATDWLDAQTLARVVDSMLELAHSVIAQPDCPFALLPLAGRREPIGGEPLSGAAADDVLACWSRVVERAPHASAVRYEDDALTRGGLDAAANALAAELIRRGVGPEVRVGVHAGRSIELVIGLLAVFKAGGVYVPLDPALPAERLAYQAHDSGIALMLSDGTPEWAASVPVVGFDVNALDAAPSDTPDPAVVQRLAVNPAQAAYVIYTSGSTGRPKGVIVSRGALASYVAGVLTRLALPDSVTSMAMISTAAADLGHTVLFGALCSGRLLHLIAQERAFDPDRFAHYMREHRVDVLKIVPSHLQALLNARDAADAVPRHTLVLGGEAARWELIDRVVALSPSIRIFNHYGPTETTVGVLTQHAALACRNAATLPVGRPLPGGVVHVLDACLGAVPVGVPGELYVGGPGVATGYGCAAGQTASRFVADPFSDGGRLYRTGDRVRELADGALEFLGRTDDQVKVRGYRVELSEVANALSAQPEVRAAHVVAHDAGDGRTALHAYVVPQSGCSIAVDALRERLARSVPDYMVPAAVVILDALPLTANGKVDRAALPQPGGTQVKAFEAPRGALETALAEVWADVLGIDVERVGRADNFFELGGDSILGLKVVARSRKRGVQIQPKHLFERPTLMALAETAEAQASGAQEASPAIALLGEAAREAGVAASYGQARQWFLWQLEPDSTAYHIGVALRIRGALDEAAVRWGFESLVRRQEGLRTVFRANEDGAVEQVVQAAGSFGLEVVDLGGVEDAVLRGEQVLAHARDVSARPFDLEAGPLLRVALIRETAGEHVLVVVMHHIVSDGWSMQIVLDEFVAQYEARVKGGQAELRALEVQYGDYAVWQRNWLEAGERERQLGYWRAQLGATGAGAEAGTQAGAEVVLELPVDHARRAQGNYTGAQSTRALPVALVAGLQQRAQGQGATLFMVLLAGFMTLLQRYAGQEEIRVGVPVANRQRAEIEAVVGLFVNTQVLRNRITGRQSLSQVLAQTREAALGAQAHPDLPFEQLVEALQPQRRLGHSPLFQVMFNHQRQDHRSLERLAGLEMESLELGGQQAQFELSVDTVEEADGSVSVSATYAAELFDASTIGRMMGHYVAVLEALAWSPEQAVADVRLLDDAQREALLQWGENRTRHDGTQPVHALFERQVEVRLDAVALVYGDTQLSYRELNEAANRVAHELIARGVGPEVKVGLALERGIGMAVGVLGVLKSGGAYVPLDPQYPAERLSQMMEDSGLKVVLCESALAAQLPQKEDVTLIALDTLDLSSRPVYNPAVPLHGGNLAYQIYTSGSTGRPKGVMVLHRALSHFIRTMQDAPGLCADDVLVAVTSLSFDIAALELYLPLSVGARVVLAAREVVRDGAALARLVQDSKATALQSTPAGWRLLRAGGWPTAPLGRFRGLCGGEALQPDLARDLSGLGVELWNMYGPTETTIWSAAGRVRDASPVLGSAIAGTQLYVLDGALNLAPVGVAGELYIGGVLLARGYHGRAGLSAERFVADPFAGGEGQEQGGRLYRTGDVVRWNARGELEYLGRTDHQVKVRGFRIELGEIEAQLLAQPGVREAVVVARQGAGGAKLVGYVSMQGDHTTDALAQSRGDVPADPAAITAKLHVSLAAVLPDYMVPSALMVLESLPLNANGKVDRHALPEPHITPEAGYEAPQGEVEEALAQIWSEVLAVEKISRHDNFFELGGHSLLATMLVSRIALKLNARISLRSVFQLPHLARLAEHVQQCRLDANDPADVSALVPIARGATMPLSPLQMRLWTVDRFARAQSDAHAYNISAAVKLSGALDLTVLRATLDALVERHEILRTAYEQNDDGDPVAVIASHLTIDLPLTDWSAALGDATMVQRALDDFSAQPFDLTRAPPLRAAVLRLAQEQHVLLLCVHHIAFDGWSEAIFVREFAALYASLRDGSAQPLARLPVQYADYAVWHTQKLARDRAAQSTFWRTCLNGAPKRSCLPEDGPPQNGTPQTGTAVSVTVAVATTTRLKQVARENGTSLFMLLFASFLFMLHRQTGSDDLVVGTDVAGRHDPQLEDLIGFFVNVVPVRSRLNRADTFTQWLARVNDRALSAFEHQDMPFDQIVELADVPRAGRAMPLVQTLFVMQNMPQTQFEIPGLLIEGVPAAAAPSKFDLAVFVSEGSQDLQIEWSYAATRYRRETIARASADWADLLQQIAGRPDALLAQYTLCRVKEPLMSEIPTTPAQPQQRPLTGLSKLDKLRKIAAGTPVAKPAVRPDSAVRTSFLADGRPFPIVIEPASPDLDALAWARAERAFVETMLNRHAGILFRNFGLRTPQDFEAFAEALEPELHGSYGDLPKKEGGRNTYRSTPYPEREMILYHNESSHTGRWPRKQWFFCELPCAIGGATPIVDCREMLRRLPAELVDEMARKELLYVRNFHPRFDVSWRDFFKTDSRDEVEGRLAKSGIAWRWLDGDVLQTRTPAPAVITHPETGERAFFNQLQLHHASCLAQDVRDDLTALVGADNLPRNVYYGDGSVIGDDIMALIGRLYEACAVRFEWRQGDVVMLDNMLAAHARDPYEGPRKIVVAMGAMLDRAMLDTANGAHEPAGLQAAADDALAGVQG